MPSKMSSKMVKTMLRQCLAIARREILLIWRDKDLRYILLLGPLVGLLLFYGIYSRQVLVEIPTAIVDLDRSQTSQELIKNIGAAENLRITTFAESYKELEDLIAKGTVVTGIVIPENYGRDLSLARQTRLAMIIDGSNMIYATNATSTMLSISRTLGAQAGIKTLIGRGIAPNQAQAAYQSVACSEEAWFNPTLNYAYFVVLALGLNMWQQCCTLVACMTIAGETCAASWCQLKSLGISRLKLFISKSATQIAAFIAAALPVFFLAVMVFKLPLHCSLPLFFLFNLAFAVALHSVGVLASSIARTPVNAARFGMLIALPSFLLSGYTYPLESMPGLLQTAAQALPQTWYFQGLNLLSFKNPDYALMSPNFLAFLLISAVCYATSAIIVAKKT